MASMTVTATQSGTGANNGTTLTVKVITGQAASPIGATAESATTTTPELAITPTGTGSRVYGATINGASATAFTAASNTTFTQNVTAYGGVAEGTFRLTGLTTAGTPVTVGATAPSGLASGNCDIALAEILTAGTLAEDASSPAVVNANAETVTTASFTPPAGSLLVASAVSNATGSGPVALTITGGGLTWTARSVSGNASGTGYAAVWTAPIPSVAAFTVAQRGNVAAAATVTTAATTAGNTLIALAVSNVSTSTSATCTNGTTTWPMTPAVYTAGHGGDYTGAWYLPSIAAGITSITVSGAYSVAFLEVAGLGSAPWAAATGTAGSASNGTSFSVGNPAGSAADFTVFNLAYDASQSGTAYADGTGNQVAQSYYGQYSYTTGTGGASGSFPSETYDACAVSFAPGYGATLAGAGTVTAPAVLGAHATLAGASAVTALGGATGAAALTAATTTAGAGTAGANSTLAGVSSLAALSAVTAPATLAGVSSLPAPHGTVAGVTTLAAGGGLAAACSVAAHATLPGAGGVTGTGVQAGTATLTGASTATAAGGVAGVTEMDGAGTLIAFAGSQSATLTAAGVLSAAALAPGGAELDGTSYLSATVVVGGAAEMDGATGLGAQPAILYSALLAATGDIDPGSTLQAVATLAGAGALSVTSVGTSAASMAGAGTVSAAGVIPGTARLGSGWAPLTYTAGILGPVMNPFTAPGISGDSGGGVLTATGTVTGTAILSGSGGLTTAQSTGATAVLAATTSMVAGQGTQVVALLAATTVLGASSSAGVSASLAADTELEGIAVNQTLYEMSFM